MLSAVECFNNVLYNSQLTLTLTYTWPQFRYIRPSCATLRKLLAHTHGKKMWHNLRNSFGMTTKLFTEPLLLFIYVHKVTSKFSYLLWPRTVHHMEYHVQVPWQARPAFSTELCYTHLGDLYNVCTTKDLHVTWHVAKQLQHGDDGAGVANCTDARNYETLHLPGLKT